MCMCTEYILNPIYIAWLSRDTDLSVRPSVHPSLDLLGDSSSNRMDLFGASDGVLRQAFDCVCVLVSDKC